jgi:predicted MFS family arabinose efflux permease
MIGVPLLAQLNFSGFLHGRPRKKPFLLTGISLRVFSLLLIALSLLMVSRIDARILLFLVYAELLLFTLSGAFAGLSYIDLVGKSFPAETRKRFFTRKQIISSVGILISALIARTLLRRLEFPSNYFSLFAAAAVMLLIASGGFWLIRERPGKTERRRSYVSTLKSIPELLRRDPNLRSYLGYVNSIGFHVALIPFYVSFAKTRYALDEQVVGNLLLMQIIGMILASLLWPRLVRRGGFKLILRVWAGVSALLPFAALLFGSLLPARAYTVLFLFTGTAVSARQISRDAVVVELSSEENRVLYTAVIGTLNLSVVVLPIVLGGLLQLFGYYAVFSAVGLASASGLYFLRRLSCPVDSKIPQPSLPGTQ